MSEFPNFLSRKFLAAWAVLALSLACTLIGWQFSARLTEERARAELDAAADALVSEMSRRMSAYEQVLHAGAALFAASGEVSRAEWRDFVAHMKVDAHFPGIQGVGFARRIAPAELAAHIRAVRAEGFPDYTVRPEGARETYTPIVYLEPFAGRNLRAFGFDMASEPVRRAAMLRACDTADGALSGKVKLVQETEHDVQPGFLLYVPVYKKVSPRNTVEERRAALLGWTYAPFRMNDFMRAFVSGAGIVDIEIFDGETAGEAETLFDLVGQPRFTEPPSPLWQRQEVLKLAGHRWTVQFQPQPAFAAKLDATPRLVLAGGVLVSLLLFAIAAALATTRERAFALAGRLNRDLQRAHDELESRVAERTAEIERLFDASPMVIAYMVDRRYLKVSRAAEALLGYPPEELLGRTSRMVYPSDADYEAAGESLRAQFAESGHAVLDVRLLRKDGSEVWARFHGRLIDPLDPSRGIIYLTEDITEQRRAEEQIRAQIDEIVRQNQSLAEANRARGVFLQTMRHELRNPLNAIIGFAELLATGIPQPLPEEQRRYAQDILDSGQSLLKLIDEILLFNAGESGALKLELRSVDVKSFLTERLRNIAGAAGRKRIALACEVADDLPRLLADSRQLRTLIDHLLDNAVKFTPEGGSVTLRAASLPSPPVGEGENHGGGSYLEIAVADTGIGIAAENLPRLFKPFAQLDADADRKAAGTGMGLALAQRLARLHGGHIEVDSEPGRGSTFTLRLPWHTD